MNWHVKVGSATTSTIALPNFWLYINSYEQLYTFQKMLLFWSNYTSPPSTYIHDVILAGKKKKRLQNDPWSIFVICTLLSNYHISFVPHSLYNIYGIAIVKLISSLSLVVSLIWLLSSTANDSAFFFFVLLSCLNKLSRSLEYGEGIYWDIIEQKYHIEKKKLQNIRWTTECWSYVPLMGRIC